MVAVDILGPLSESGEDHAEAEPSQNNGGIEPRKRARGSDTT